MAALAVLCPSPLFRAGLVSLLATLGFDNVEEAATTKDLKQRLNGGPVPEILLVSLSRPIEPIANSMDEIRTLLPDAKIVFLAADLDLELLGDCFAAGASGYLLENISRGALQESLRLVRAGEKVFPSQLASLIPGFASMLNGATNGTAELRDLNFSEREIDILRCLAVGQSNKLIAKKLNIAESTVKVHLKRIMRKTRASNRTQAALWGAARGLTLSPASTPGQMAR
jgi:two-component system nitrate/nitrite response regulator NarL